MHLIKLLSYFTISFCMRKKSTPSKYSRTNDLEQEISKKAVKRMINNKEIPPKSLHSKNEKIASFYDSSQNTHKAIKNSPADTEEFIRYNINLDNENLAEKKLFNDQSNDFYMIKTTFISPTKEKNLNSTCSISGKCSNPIKKSNSKKGPIPMYANKKLDHTEEINDYIFYLYECFKKIFNDFHKMINACTGRCIKISSVRSRRKNAIEGMCEFNKMFMNLDCFSHFKCDILALKNSKNASFKDKMKSVFLILRGFLETQTRIQNKYIKNRTYFSHTSQSCNFIGIPFNEITNTCTDVLEKYFNDEFEIYSKIVNEVFKNPKKDFKKNRLIKLFFLYLMRAKKIYDSLEYKLLINDEDNIVRTKKVKNEVDEFSIYAIQICYYNILYVNTGNPFKIDLSLFLTHFITKVKELNENVFSDPELILFKEIVKRLKECYFNTHKKNSGEEDKLGDVIYQKLLNIIDEFQD